MIIRLEFYKNFRPCLLAMKGDEVFGKLSTNVLSAPIPRNEFILKTYSENVFWAKDLIDKHPEWFINTNNVYKVGLSYCPIYRLSPVYVNLEFEKTYNPRTDIYEASPPLWNLYHETCVTVQNDQHQSPNLGNHG